MDEISAINEESPMAGPQVPFAIQEFQRRIHMMSFFPFPWLDSMSQVW